MEAPRLEVAEVFRRCQDQYACSYTISHEQQRVIRDLITCRTAVLGGHLRRCQACGHEEIAYNSCRNRHCPKCQAQKQAAWLEAQRAHLLAVPYYHVVFTLPEALGPLALQNKRLAYGLLFRAASETLLTKARDPRHLGAQIGFTAVLHTWGQTLLHHPHLHCVVPAGGLAPDGQRWISPRENFFLPVRVLSRLFRAKYLAFLRQAYQSDALILAGQLERLASTRAWQAFLAPLYQKDWVVYAKPPFGSPDQVLKYLARYTHRVAISNRRLVSFENDQVAFSYKAYRCGGKRRILKLEAVEFMRRFLLHVLPFVRIRHYGLIANRCQKEKLLRCRELIAQEFATVSSERSSAEDSVACNDLCPVCKEGHLVVVGKVAPSSVGPEPRMNSPNDA